MEYMQDITKTFTRRILLNKIKCKLEESFIVIEDNFDSGNTIQIDKEIEKTYEWLVEFSKDIKDEIVAIIVKEIQEILLLVAVENAASRSEFSTSKLKLYITMFRNKIKEWRI
jgi:hypothetical protein